MSAHEDANFRLMAQSMGPELFNATYKLPNGEGAYNHFMGQFSQQGNGNQMRYANEQVQGFNGGQSIGYPQSSGQQAPYQGNLSQQNSQSGQFSGYGSPNQTYGVNSSREWKMGSNGQATSQYYDRLPKVFGKAITATHKDGRGNIEAFRLEDGTTFNYAQMMQAIASGNQSGLRLQQNQEGELVIRSVPDGFTDNNLDNLPQF